MVKSVKQQYECSDCKRIFYNLTKCPDCQSVFIWIKPRNKKGD